MLKQRASGILLHISSLPSEYGIGDFGPGAYSFADFLAGAGQSCWQILPLHPTDEVNGQSPYSSISAFAGNVLFISPALLIRHGFVSESALGVLPDFPRSRVNYPMAAAYKQIVLDAAFETFVEKRINIDEYRKFCRKNAFWLEDFALFDALKSCFNGMAWCDWPAPLRDRQAAALLAKRKSLTVEIEKRKFFQFLFFSQWMELKKYCAGRNVKFIGDIPLYVNYDSADVWCHPELFLLDEKKRPAFVAGVPPDYFSSSGQRWGNPIYHWKGMRKTGFGWWLLRLRHALSLFDLVRIDHFRGLVAFWQIPSVEKSAVNGKWIKAPVRDFLRAVQKAFPAIPLIAEDLGVITPDVCAVMKEFGLPGMKVLLFAFGEENPRHPYLPHVFEPNSLVYTGTHDNNTVRGWFENETTPDDRGRLFRYLGADVHGHEVHWKLIRLAMMSVAETAIFPMQDVLGLGQEARMNRPATIAGNWQWRLLQEQMEPAVQNRLKEMTVTYGRNSQTVF